MPDEGGMASAVAHLDVQTDQIERSLQAARTDIANVSRGVEEVRRSQAQAKAAAESANARLLEAMRENRQDVADLRRMADEGAASLAKLHLDVARMQDVLDRLLAAQVEERARAQRESEFGGFAVRLNDLLRGISDVPVRIVFAVLGLAALDARKVLPENFRDTADKEAVSSIRGRLTDAARSGSGAERAEAERYLSLASLQVEATQLRTSYETRRTELSAMAKRHHDEVSVARGEVARLETPEGALEAARRRSFRNAFCALGAAIVAGTAAATSLVDETFALGIPLGIALLLAGWFHGESHRRGSLRRSRSRLAKREELLSGFERTTTSEGQAFASSLRRLRAQWGTLSLPMPPEASLDDPSRSLAAAVLVIGAAKSSWEAAHPQIAVIRY